MATETITLNSSGRRSVVRALTVDHVVACTAVSAGDVFVNAMTDVTRSLEAGDSMLAPRGTLTLRLFRRSTTATDEFSATVDLTPSPRL